jgi:hypothetical protein
MLTLPALLLAGIVFVVLFVILGVTLWVSIVAAAGAFALWALVGGAGSASRPPTAHRS